MDTLMALAKAGPHIEAGADAATARTRLAGFVLAVMARVAQWRDRVRQRHLLAQLPERELRDIGISRYDAMHEWRKPFWRD